MLRSAADRKTPWLDATPWRCACEVVAGAMTTAMNNLIGWQGLGLKQAPPTHTWSSIRCRVGRHYGLELLDLALKADFPTRASIERIPAQVRLKVPMWAMQLRVWGLATSEHQSFSTLRWLLGSRTWL